MPTIDLSGPVHYADHGGSGPPMLLIHGLGGSLLNWMAVAPELSRKHRVLSLDLVGFGMTEPAGRTASLASNRALIGRFIDEVIGEPPVLVGNSMGGLLSILETAREPAKVAGLVLVNPALPRAMGAKLDPLVFALFAGLMAPGLGAMVVRRRATALGPERLVMATLKLCCRDTRTVPRQVVAAHIDQARRRAGMKGAERAYLQAARSLVAYLARRRHFEKAAKSIKVPTLLIHGRHDRLVPLDSAQALAKLRPDWTFEVMDHVGHVPQMEDPAGFVRRVEDWSASAAPGREAAQSRHRRSHDPGNAKQAAGSRKPQRRAQSQSGPERAT